MKNLAAIDFEIIDMLQELDAVAKDRLLSMGRSFSRRRAERVKPKTPSKLSLVPTGTFQRVHNIIDGAVDQVTTDLVCEPEGC